MKRMLSRRPMRVVCEASKTVRTMKLELEIKKLDFNSRQLKLNSTQLKFISAQLKLTFVENSFNYREIKL